MGEKRPNPDTLLKFANAEEIRRKRGRLKIYLGMAAGVGKTYSMLADALGLKGRGVDVVAGYIEPHGRPETTQLANSLDSIPPKIIQHAGIELREFDVDASLLRKPEILLVDELAHTNAPGSRHIKRWQDVEEILSSGIDVYTTLNIQHLESLRDVVSQITGITVHETVPDRFLNNADEVELVDIPPNELIDRLKQGKIYPLSRVDTALQNFFKEGTLIALRELVLRQTAERVNAQMRRYRLQNAVREVWPTGQRVLVCVGASPMAPQLIRAAKRLATSLHAELIAVNFHTPKYALRSLEGRADALAALDLAELLGAKVMVRQSNDMVTDILTLCSDYNVTAIVIGKPVRPRWKEIFSRTLVDELIRRSGTISVHVLATVERSSLPGIKFSFKGERKPIKTLRTFFVVALCTGLAALIYPFLDLSNIIMIYFLGVTWVSTRQSYREALLSCLLSVAAFDFFFVPPRFTFAVADAQYLITFFVMLVISILISTLTIRLKVQSQMMSERERRTATLYDFGRELLSCKAIEEVSQAVFRKTTELFQQQGALFLSSDGGVLVLPTEAQSIFSSNNELAVATWVLNSGTSAGVGTNTLSGAKGFYFPLKFQEQCLGVLGMTLPKPLPAEERSLFEAFGNQVTLALQRIAVENESRQADLIAKTERLRSSLLSSISHDLRTPLAAISGSASALVEQQNLPQANRVELAQTIWDESERLTRIIRNVLDLTKLEGEGRDGEGIKLHREWHSLEELIGSALHRTEKVLKPRKVIVKVDRELPLIYADGLLLEQVFVNILENAAKHTPETTLIEIEATRHNSSAVVILRDNGPGLKAGDEEKVFEKLYRGEKTPSQGFGLGLTICRSIAEAHGGSIQARNRGENNGAEFELILPLGDEAPEVPL